MYAEIGLGAVTGRASIDGTDEQGNAKKKQFSMMEMEPQTPEEAKMIRQAVVADGFILSIFDLLRRLPKRLLMVLKLKSVLVFVQYEQG